MGFTVPNLDSYARVIVRVMYHGENVPQHAYVGELNGFADDLQRAGYAFCKADVGCMNPKFVFDKSKAKRECVQTFMDRYRTVTDGRRWTIALVAVPGRPEAICVECRASD